MKRIIALVLVFAMMIMPTAVFADDAATEPAPPVHENKIPKEVIRDADRKNPSETFKFEFEAVGNNPAEIAIPDVEIPFTVGQILGEKDIDLSNFVGSDVPYGEYNYSVEEVAGNTAGYTYTTLTGELKVLKQRDTNGTDSIKAYLVLYDNDMKADAFKNEFKAGDLKVTKKLEPKAEDTFTIEVVLTPPADKVVKLESVTFPDGTEFPEGFNENSEISAPITVTIPITTDEDGNGSFTIKDLPEGVTYKVAEINHEGYVVEYDVQDGTIAENVESVVNVTNYKEQTPPTGITMDNMPYVLLLAFAVVGLGVFIVRRRTAEEQ